MLIIFFIFIALLFFPFPGFNVEYFSNLAVTHSLVAKFKDGVCSHFLKLLCLNINILLVLEKKKVYFDTLHLCQHIVIKTRHIFNLYVLFLQMFLTTMYCYISTKFHRFFNFYIFINVYGNSQTPCESKNCKTHDKNNNIYCVFTYASMAIILKF